jgi:hypothetical protein
MCRPSRLTLEGRPCVVVVVEPGLRWTRQRRVREAWAGRIALREPEASCRRAALSGSSRQYFDGNVHNAVGPCGEMASRAYGKTVWSWPSLLRSSLCGCGTCVNRRGVRDFREGEGGQQELGSRESTAYAVKPLRREGRVIWLHLYAAVRFPCATLSRSGPRVPAGTRPSLRPPGQEGGSTKQSSGEMRREDAKVCLQLKWMRAGRVALPPHTSSLRAQRSNPESYRGGTLDCFAALAKTT